MTDYTKLLHPQAAADFSFGACNVPFCVDLNKSASTAWTNAITIAPKLVAKLKPGNYDRIHFIAHSAGSNLVNIAADDLKNQAKITRPNRPLITTITFLDAFDPSGTGAAYGASADWAEHYVDLRTSTIVTGSSKKVIENSNLITSVRLKFEQIQLVIGKGLN